LTATPPDPIYGLTKHAVIGFVRSVAPQLASQGIRINAVCPGYTDTNMVPDELRDVLDVPLMDASFVAQAAMEALNDEETGGAWVVQPNRIVPFRFPHIPGPR
jgi:NAD(P)-dependent dehydrogenase (short-subunit alcohol dehydrogenase family)